jgi:tRNA-dihydrouridine synthase B
MPPSGPITIGGITLPGRAFLAPLAAYTSWPFRRICRRMGAAFATTEVFKARELARHLESTLQIIEYRPDEHPIAAQMLSKDPAEAGEVAAMLCEMGFDMVDLNCGCPKRRVVSDGIGAGMMATPKVIGDVVAGMVAQSKVPITVKIRAGLIKGEPTCIEAAQRAEAAGAASVCVHPRYGQGASSLPPEWPLIAEVKKAVSIPVIGNGGIRFPEDALRMFNETGCDAVLIGTASMGRPWIFRQIDGLLATGEVTPVPDHDEILDILLEHYEGLVEHHGEKRGSMMMRKQSCHYAKSLKNGKLFNQAVIQASTREEYLSAVDYWLRDGYKKR